MTDELRQEGDADATKASRASCDVDAGAADRRAVLAEPALLVDGPLIVDRRRATGADGALPLRFVRVSWEAVT